MPKFQVILTTRIKPLDYISVQHRPLNLPYGVDKEHYVNLSYLYENMTAVGEGGSICSVKHCAVVQLLASV